MALLDPPSHYHPTDLHRGVRRLAGFESAVTGVRLKESTFLSLHTSWKMFYLVYSEVVTCR